MGQKPAKDHVINLKLQVVGHIPVLDDVSSHYLIY